MTESASVAVREKLMTDEVNLTDRLNGDAAFLDMEAAKVDYECGATTMAKNLRDAIKEIATLTQERDALLEQIALYKAFMQEIMVINNRLLAERDALRAALNEVRTNGEWTDGDQCGEWKISKEVYGLVCDALTGERT